ncbi:MAG TPA: hypothetical protein VF533_06040, partial [Solirubrobacteraceae bacterium]
MRASFALAVAVLLGAPATSAGADTETVWPRGGAYQVAAAGNGRGDAVVAFRNRRGVLYTAFASRGGRFGRPRPVRGGRVGRDPEAIRVAIDERGDALIAWTSDDASYDPDPLSRDEGCCYRVRAFVRRRSERLTRVRTINRRGDSAALIDADAARGRFGLLWQDYEAEAVARLAVGGVSGRFGQRRTLPGKAEPVGLALSPRRVLVHRLRGGARRRDKLTTLRYSGRRLGRPRRGVVRGTRAVDSLGGFSSTVRGDVLGLHTTYAPRYRTRIVTGGRGSRARRVRGGYDRAALAGSG